MAFSRTVRQFWSFYRQYTDTALHTAAAAGLAIFGLLVFVDPLFAVVAIGCYVVPPVVLYVLEARAPPSRPAPDWSGRDIEPDHDRNHSDGDGSDSIDSNSTDGDTDTDSDTDDGDTDSDDGDTDTDTVGS